MAEHVPGQVRNLYTQNTGRSAATGLNFLHLVIIQVNVEEHVQHVVELMATQGASRGIIREIIAYTAGARAEADKVSSQRYVKQNASV